MVSSINFSHKIAINLMNTHATKEVEFFAYLVALALHLFNFKNAFSTKCRLLYTSLSYSLGLFLLFRGGITTSIFLSLQWFTIVSLSYPLSPITPLHLSLSTSSIALVQSAVTPSVIINVLGLPDSSTAICIFVLIPLLI